MKPLLAGKFDESKQKFPLLASAKLDGVRCIIIDGVAMSRSLKPIPNAHVQSVIGKSRLNGLDGELMVGPIGSKTVYRDTVSGVMRAEGDPAFKFWVFDRVIPNQPFYERFASLYDIPLIGSAFDVLSHYQMSDRDELYRFEDKQLNLGLEGVMVRDPNGPYKFGRSSTNEGILLKLKRFEDSEAVILSIEELQQNNNAATTNALGHTARSSHKANLSGKGTMGALNVRDIHTGVEFSIGTGFDTATRDEYWATQPIGTIIKYKYFAGGSKDKPRFPVYLGVHA